MKSLVRLPLGVAVCITAACGGQGAATTRAPERQLSRCESLLEDLQESVSAPATGDDEVVELVAGLLGRDVDELRLDLRAEEPGLEAQFHEVCGEAHRLAQEAQQDEVTVVYPPRSVDFSGGPNREQIYDAVRMQVDQGAYVAIEDGLGTVG